MSNDVIPVEERIKEAFPSERGLYPHEILALEYAPRCTNQDTSDSFQNFWWYDYGVKDVSKVLLSLYKNGFLQIENIEDAAKNESNVTLKNMLIENNLKTNGKKEDMIQRLFENIQINTLEKLFFKRKYQLTELGIDELNKSKYISYIHGNRTIEDLNIWSLNKLIYTNSKMSFRDVIWKYLNQRTVKHAMEGQYGLYRNCKYTMALFLLQEDKYKNALANYAEAAFYDLSLYPNEIASGLIFDIALCIQKLNYTDDELVFTLNELTKGFSVPNQKKSSNEYVQIIIIEIKKFIKENPNLFEDEEDDFDDEIIKVNPVRDNLVNDMLLFLEKNQPILQKDFIPSWRESQPFSRIGDTKGQIYFLEEIFKYALDKDKIRREKVGRAFTLYVNK